VVAVARWLSVAEEEQIGNDREMEVGDLAGRQVQPANKVKHSGTSVSYAESYDPTDMVAVGIAARYERLSLGPNTSARFATGPQIYSAGLT
jgi:hypothetical protein